MILKLKRDKHTFKALEHSFELPMLLATILLLAVIIIKESFTVSPFFSNILEYVDFGIWTLFVIELGTMTYISSSRLKYLRNHWYDAVIVFLPFFRLFRLLHLEYFKYLEGALLYIFNIFAQLFGSDAQLVRVFPLLARGINNVKKLFKRHQLDYIIYIILAIVVFLGSLASVFESRAPGSNINSIFDGIWWGLVSISTVGYGDYFPITVQGRIIGVVLITIGVVLFSLLTAHIASGIMGETEQADQKELRKRLNEIEDSIEDIREVLEEQNNSRTSNSKTSHSKTTKYPDKKAR